MKRRDVRGYVLLEALVALLIFSLGLLGMIGFQAASTRIVTDSRFRTEAAILADELIAKMSVDKRSVVIANYAYDSEGGGGGASTRTWFETRVIEASKLPNPKVKVDVASGASVDTFTVTVRIQWDLPSSGTSDKALKQKAMEHGNYETQALLF
ncbi:MAG: pilus assembly protein PilV [Zoogloea sp.]|nr:pilus assembly protein PilV [Zoogloea sp.]